MLTKNQIQLINQIETQRDSIRDTQYRIAELENGKRVSERRIEEYTKEYNDTLVV